MTSIRLDAYVENGSDPDIADLHLVPANGYSVIRHGVTVGGRVWDKDVIEAGWVNGRFVIAQRLLAITGTVKVRVGGATTAQLFSRYAALVEAVEQFSWELRLVIDGQTVRFRCETADTAPSGDDGTEGELDEISLMRHVQVCTVSFTRAPIALAGPF